MIGFLGAPRAWFANIHTCRRGRAFIPSPLRRGGCGLSMSIPRAKASLLLVRPCAVYRWLIAFKSNIQLSRVPSPCAVCQLHVPRISLQRLSIFTIPFPPVSLMEVKTNSIIGNTQIQGLFFDFHHQFHLIGLTIFGNIVEAFFNDE